MLILAPLNLEGLVLLAKVSYAAWVAYGLTAMDRVSAFGHPAQSGHRWEDVTFLAGAAK